MKTWKRALALVLALVMALSLVALPSFATDEGDAESTAGLPRIQETGSEITNDGLVMSKTVAPGENGQFLLTLEAYATGQTATTVSELPLDIVLVLDVSGSMGNELGNYNPVYSVSNNGTYYYQAANGQYQQAYYCDGEYYYSWTENGTNHTPGWYSANHQNRFGNCQGETGIRLTPKTFASDTDTSHTQFYTMSSSGTTRLEALQAAVNNFAESVSTKAKGADGQYGTNDDVEHRIAVVSFADNANNLTNGLVEMDKSQGLSTVRNAVNNLSAKGNTDPAKGLNMANSIFSSNPTDDQQRSRVVVLFTDGYPAGKNTDDINYVWCDDAIASAQTSKNTYKASVYTVGIFEGANPDSDIDTNFTYDTRTKHGQSAAVQLVAANRYMHYTSSNYKDAQSMQNGGTKNSDGYYLSASDANGLNSVFQKISQTAGGSTLKLGSGTVLRDVISRYFDLPAGADENSITAQSYACTGFTSDNKPTWATTPDADKYDGVTLSADRKTVEVTGFDYAANYVGKDTTTGQQHNPAKKLVVTIPIQLTDKSATGEVPTNGANSCISGKNGTEDVTFDFPTPTVYIPYFTVTHVASTVDSATGANKGEVKASENYPLWCHKEFDLTSVVTEKYLYGGTFNEETCTTVHKDVQRQGNPMKLNPTENATYYIWEVPDTYLRPFAFWVSRHLEGGNGTQNVTQMYLLSLLDRVNYLDAGLYVQFEGDDKGEYISSGCEQLTGKTGVNKATVYQMLEYALCTAPNDILETWYLVDGNVTTFKGKLNQNAGKYLDGTNSAARVIDDGCIIGHRLDNGENGEFAKFQDHSVTYRPYWITQDGVRVEGLRDRTYSFVKDSDRPTKSHVNSYETKDAYEFVGTGTQAVQTLSLRTNMLTAESEPAVENVTVTVVDAAKTYELTVSAGTGIRDQVAYQAPAGKVFAGWFTDQAYTTPADLDQVTEDTTIYAKYVSDSYLDLAYSRTGLFRLRGVTLISAVDNPANYQASGFIVGDQKVDVSYASRYLIFKTPANLFGAARDAKLMLADKSLSGTGTLEVTPYWVTLDGTEVHGVTHTLHYNTRTIWE